MCLFFSAFAVKITLKRRDTSADCDNYTTFGQIVQTLLRISRKLSFGKSIFFIYTRISFFLCLPPFEGKRQAAFGFRSVGARHYGYGDIPLFAAAGIGVLEGRLVQHYSYGSLEFFLDKRFSFFYDMSRAKARCPAS